MILRSLTGLAASLMAVSTLACAQEQRSRQAEPDRWRDEVAQAESALKRGDRSAAVQMAEDIAAQYETSGARNSSEYTSAGRAYVLLEVGDAEATKAALRTFDRAVAADSDNIDAIRRTAALFLDKYNAPDARASYELALQRAPDDAAALLGLARVEEFEGKSSSMTLAQRSLRADPRSAETLAYLAGLHLDAEAFDSAEVYARRAVDSDSSNMYAWSVLGSIAWITGDSLTFQRALAAATAIQPEPAAFHLALAESAIRQRRYSEAVELARKAVQEDSLLVPAWGVLGTTQLRLGQMQAGRNAVERAFALDPFNLWHKNTLDLLDKMDSFSTIRKGRFEVVAPASEADLLAHYIIPLLERAYDSLSLRYGYSPETPVRLEFYRQHADFSVRTVGLNGLGALGVSFGSLLAMDAPDAREKGSFNWGSTAWHELAHAFTLGASDHRVPRWLSEGLSVLEERRAASGWGARTTLPWVLAYNRGTVRPVSQLNDGFLRPRYPEETAFSYYQASLFSEWVESTLGISAIRALLEAYKNGEDTPGAFRAALGMTPEEADKAFDTWVRTRFKTEFAAVAGSGARDSSGGKFVSTMRSAVALTSTRPDSASKLFESARGMFPSYSGEDGPAWFLSQLTLQAGDTLRAVSLLSEVTNRSETAYQANMLEANLREQSGDKAGAAAALERLIWIWPLDNSVHERLALLSMETGKHEISVRERRAVIMNQPADMLNARYELARALAVSGDTAAARSEVLSVLEEAPGFEKAQTLLLELRQKREDKP